MAPVSSRSSFNSGAALAWVVLVLTCASPAPAQEPARAASAAEPHPDAADEKERRRSELRRIEEALAASGQSRKRMEGEVAELKRDAGKLDAALVQAGERVQAAEERIRTLEQRLDSLTTSESAIRRSLEARRAVIAEVLAALQRMGERPPPALLVRPQDVVSAIRTAMLLGAVLPELREETAALATDLAELARLKETIAADREAFRRQAAELSAERERLAALTAARQERLAEAQGRFAEERERAARLAGEARTLKELIDGMERNLNASARAAENARRAADNEARELRERVAAAALSDPARLAPKVPFSEAKGFVPRPASGHTIRDFGADDGYGGTARGVSIATRPRAVVTSPADGWVAFAGPFRSFGRLLIINAGNGYYLLLAGMDHISVEVGQFVLAGEPVAVMGETSTISPAAGAVEASDPVLYVEFRRDGASIDPGPWWAKSQGEKVRG
jgi:septal ring factor EnvC (AmiA/AmiB activator)